MTEQSRKSFEEWCTQEYGIYAKLHMDGEEFDAWQASKACEQARIMELLDSPELFEQVQYILNSSTVRGSHTNAVIEAIKQKIGE